MARSCDLLQVNIQIETNNDRNACFLSLLPLPKFDFAAVLKHQLLASAGLDPLASRATF